MWQVVTAPLFSVAIRALLSALNGVGLTSTGDFYIADTADHVVRKVSTFMVLLIS